MNHHERLPLFNLGADFLNLGNTNSWIVFTIFLDGQLSHAFGDEAGVDGMHIATLGRGQLAHMLSGRELIRIVDDRRIAALRFNHVLKLLQRGAILEVSLHRLLRGKRRTSDTCEADDFHAQLEHKLPQILRAFAFEKLDRFLDFKRSAHSVTEWLIHIGDECDTAALH